MLAFVTGASGFIGLNIVEELTRMGWSAIALHRASSDLIYLRRFPVRLVEGSVEDLASLERAIPAGLDAMFHVAADVSLWSRNNARQTRTNVEGTRNVVAVSLARGVKKLIHTSTQNVYGFVTGEIDETAPHLGRGSWFNYMHSKTLAEDEVRAGIVRGLDASIINPSHVIGRYDRKNWARLILLASAGELPRLPPGTGSYCHATEVARAHIAAVMRGRTGENYLLGGVNASFPEVIRIVSELIGRRISRRTVTAPLLRAAGSTFDFISRFTGREPFLTRETAELLTAKDSVRSDKAIRELGYRAAPLREMLQDCCDWLAAEGLLKVRLRTDQRSP